MSTTDGAGGGLHVGLTVVMPAFAGGSASDRWPGCSRLPGIHRGRFAASRQVQCFLDRELAAGLTRSLGIAARENCPRLVDELASRRLVRVDVDDSLLLRVDLRRC